QGGKAFLVAGRKQDRVPELPRLHRRGAASGFASRHRRQPRDERRPGCVVAALTEGPCPCERSRERQWGREDSNLRRLSRRVYSPFPLAARAHPREARGIVASPGWHATTRSSSAGAPPAPRRRSASRTPERACCSSTRRASRATSRAAAA